MVRICVFFRFIVAVILKFVLVCIDFPYEVYYGQLVAAMLYVSRSACDTVYIPKPDLNEHAGRISMSHSQPMLSIHPRSRHIRNLQRLRLMLSF